jgi:hypothetical protein
MEWAEDMLIALKTTLRAFEKHRKLLTKRANGGTDHASCERQF